MNDKLENCLIYVLDIVWIDCGKNIEDLKLHDDLGNICSFIEIVEYEKIVYVLILSLYYVRF